MNERAAATTDLRNLADTLTGAFPHLDATDQRIAIATYRVLARGLPASTTEIAFAAGATPNAVEARLGTWPAVFRGGDGRVIGFWGLTINETPPHELTVGEVRLWAWFAWDTLFLPARLVSPTACFPPAPDNGSSSRQWLSALAPRPFCPPVPASSSMPW